MKTIKLIFFSLILFQPSLVFSQWSATQTGIGDNFKGILFIGSKGIVVGEKGIYYTENGGYSQNDWNTLQIQNNTQLEQLKKRTQFSGCATHSFKAKDKALICGEDTVNNKAVILMVDMKNWSAKEIYQGPINSKLNAVTFHSVLGKFVAAGDDGLIVSFDTSSYETITSPYTYDFKDVAEYSYSSQRYLVLVSSEYLVLDKIVSTTHTFSQHKGVESGMTGAIRGTSSRLRITGNSYSEYFNSYFTERPNFDVDSLNAKCIFSYKNFIFVGTSNGVYRSGPSDQTFVEKMPASIGYEVYGFAADQDTLYACATNGVILRADTVNGPTLLNMNITTPRGKCTNSNLNLTGSYGTASSCWWYIDGISAGSGCKTISKSFPTPGTYELMLVGQNADGERDTAIRSYISVTPPDKSILFSFSDTILCQQEQVTVNMDSTESEMIYSLHPYLHGDGEELEGSGSPDAFISPTISASGDYFIKARHHIANCSAVLTHSEMVTVEKTKAKIHPQSINVYEGDTARFFDKSIDAQNNLWSYNPSPSWYQSAGLESQSIYSSPSNVNVKLVAWSDDGCTDSVELSLTDIYNNSSVANNPSWSTMIMGYDTQYFRYSHNYMVPSKLGGTLIDGAHPDNPIFQSRNGNDYSSTRSVDGYVARFDSLGVLKWVVQRTRTPITYSTGGAAHQATLSEDVNRDVLLTALTKVEDSRGDEYELQTNCFYVKLNADGELKYHLNARHLKVFTGGEIHTDHDGNVYCIGGFNPHYVDLGIVIEKNGDSIGSFVPNFDLNDNFIMIKFDKDGNYKWSRTFEIPLHNNSISFTRLGFDQNKNVYITGVSRYTLMTTDPPGGSKDTISFRVNGEYSLSMFFVQKVDSLGVSQWITRGYTLGDHLAPNTVRSTTTYATQSATSKTGATYIVGHNDAYHTLYRFAFENADGSTTLAYKGKYFVMKINTNGMVEWIEGTRRMDNYFGYTRDIILDGEQDLYVLAKCMNYRNINTPSIFTSTNGDSIVVNMLPHTEAHQDYFVGHYDTSGVLYKIMLNGMNDDYNETPRNVTAHHLAKHPKGFYVTAYSEHNEYANKNEWVNWGHVVEIPPKHRPSILSSFEPNQALCIFPNETCKSRSYDIVHPISSCGPYISRSGTVYSTSGSFVDVDTTYIGCDTFLSKWQLNLQVDSAPLNVVIDTGCVQYTSATGKVYYKSGTYDENFSRGDMCDSVVRYHLTIHEEPRSYVGRFACNEYTFNTGRVTTESGPYWDTFQSIYGCDSFVHINLTIVKIDPGISRDDNKLVSADTIGPYEWYDCDRDHIIANENNRSIIPPFNRKVAVIVSRLGCKDTSECMAITQNNISEFSKGDLKLIPNPTRSNVQVILNEPVVNARISIYSTDGKLWNRESVSGKEITVDLPESAGVYYIVLSGDGSIHTAKVVKLQ